jgi:cytochrome c
MELRSLFALSAASFAAMLLLTSCASQPDPRPAARQRAVSTSAPSGQAALAGQETESHPSIPVVQAAAPLAQEAPSAEASKGDPSEGKEVFEQCSICHNVADDEAKMGPSLRGLYKKEKLSTGKAATDENIRAVINEGGNGMPGYEELLEADEMANLMAYLKTL